MVNKIYFFVAFFGLSKFLLAQNVTEWRGYERSGIYNEENLLQSWKEQGPPVLWNATSIGKGYSSTIIVDSTIYVTGMKDSTDYVTALNNKGEILWQVPFGPSWNQSFNDTRCTPTYNNSKLYVISGLGTIACIDATKGNKIWTLNATEKFSGICGTWGVCESMLIVDDKLIFTPAGPKTTMVALNKENGSVVWTSESINDTGAYVSPKLINLGQKKIIVTALSNNLIGVDATNGKILWKYLYSKLKPEESLKVWPGAPQTNTITPLYKDGYLYITGGYNHVGAMFKLSDDANNIELIWTDTTLDCHHGGVVLLDGYIYGSNWIDNRNGNWCCIEWKTGKPIYDTKWFTKGSIISANNMLYCYDEKGNLGLVKPNPLKFDLVSNFKVTYGTGPHWAHPVICKGILYIRHGDALIAYDIKAKN